MTLYLRDDIQALWQGSDPWSNVRALDGELYRQVEGRRTLRVELDGRYYFLKHHSGVGWREILKNLNQLRAPVISAYNEWRAIQCLQGLEVPTMKIAAYGSRGLNPASVESFILTEEIDNSVSLETVIAGWQRKRPAFRFKIRLIRKVADISRRMHQAGMCHRDLYLCHFLLQLDARGRVNSRARPHLSLIDLHRALVRPALGARWVRKDIAALYFSARNAGLTRTDLLRFIRYYRHISLRRELIEEESFWVAVEEKAAAIAARERSHLQRRLSREGVAYGREQSKHRLAIYRRDWLAEQPELRAELIASPDLVMDRGEMIKDGDSTTVVKVNLQGRDYAIKRYNITGLWHGLRRLCRPSRAWHCWLHAHYLQQIGLLTPKPMMMIERRFGRLRRQAWFVSEWHEGNDLLQELQAPSEDADWEPVMDQFRALFATMQREKLVHGDMKLSNFIRTERGLVLLDLDGMHFCRQAEQFTSRHNKDLNRFLRNWQPFPDLYAKAEQRVKAALRRLRTGPGFKES